MSRAWDVIVIGAGVAGLTVARVLGEAGLGAMLVDRMGPGGVLINLGDLHGVPGGSAAPELVSELLDRAMAAGIDMIVGEVGGLAGGPPWVVDIDGAAHQARAVVITTGLGLGRLGVAGEADYVGRGLSHCAACDGPLFAGEPVVVVGDDKWAIQEAIDLTHMAGGVSLVAEGLDGEAAGRLQAAGVALIDARVVALLGEDGLSGVLVDGSQGQRRLEACGVFAYSDRRPALDFAGGRLAVDAQGRVLVDPDLATNLPLVFAAGDVRSASNETVLEAIQDAERVGSCLKRLLATR
jgi:thioredoxin reductase (NADPH)